MSIPVWIWRGNYPGGGSIDFNEEQQDCGGGVVFSVMHELAFTGYNLTGENQARKGTITFEVVLNARGYGGDTQFLSIMRFLQDRKNGNNESFYYYNPDENDDPPLTPADAAADSKGRYKVKHLGKISWAKQSLQLYNFAKLEFVEDRSA